MSTPIQTAIDDLWYTYSDSTSTVPDQLHDAQQRLVARIGRHRHYTLYTLKKLAKEAKVIERHLEQLTVFPPPPIEGIPGVIEPITSPEELRHEGQTMKHSAGSKVQHVFADAYYYRLLPSKTITRATIELKTDGKQWLVNEIAGVENTMVSAESKVLVEDWIKNATPTRTTCSPHPFAQIQPVNLRDFFQYL